MKICECSATLNNTGTPSCPTLMRDAEMIILVPKYLSDGTLNTIDLTDLLDQAYFDGRVNSTDPLYRWYPLPRLKNPNSERGDAVYVDYEDLTKDFVHQGVRSFSLLLPNQEPTLLGKLESWRCQEFGIFIVDKNRSLIGMGDIDGFLRPIIIDQNSFTPNYILPKATDVATIDIKFNFDTDEQDADIRMILASEISPVNLVNLKGLLDVDSTYSSISTTGFTAKLTTQYGSILNPKVVAGLVIGDFALYNLFDSLAVTISTMVENPDGTYAFTFAAQGSGETLRLTPTKTKFDFTNVVANHIAIP